MECLDFNASYGWAVAICIAILSSRNAFYHQIERIIGLVAWSIRKYSYRFKVKLIENIELRRQRLLYFFCSNGEDSTQNQVHSVFSQMIQKDEDEFDNKVANVVQEVQKMRERNTRNKREIQKIITYDCLVFSGGAVIISELKITGHDFSLLSLALLGLLILFSIHCLIFGVSMNLRKYAPWWIKPNYLSHTLLFLLLILVWFIFHPYYLICDEVLYYLPICSLVGCMIGFFSYVLSPLPHILQCFGIFFRLQILRFVIWKRLRMLDRVLYQHYPELRKFDKKLKNSDLNFHH